MTIKWDERFRVGNSIIDTEHKLLLTIINALEMSLRHSDDKEPILFFMEQLHEFSVEHFRLEEAMQVKCQFPFRENNARGHQILEDQLTTIRDDVRRICENTPLSDEDKKLLHRHISYIAKDWLVTHLLKEDIKMKGFMGDK
jgi:hemerythrin-like metal-binding protein